MFTEIDFKLSNKIIALCLYFERPTKNFLLSCCPIPDLYMYNINHINVYKEMYTIKL